MPVMPQVASSQPQQSGTNFKEAFQLFDKRGNGLVALDQLGDLLRACGQNPTLAEIADLEKTVGNDCKSPRHEGKQRARRTRGLEG